MKRTVLVLMAVMGLLWSGCRKSCPSGGEVPATPPAEGKPAPAAAPAVKPATTPTMPIMLNRNISGTDYLATVLRSQQIGQRANSMMRLRSIGMAMQMYFSEHGQYPATLAELAKAGNVRESDLVSPVDASRPYVYLPPAGTNLSPQIVAYETVSYGGKVPVLMGDGAVLNLVEADLQEKLSARK